MLERGCCVVVQLSLYSLSVLHACAARIISSTVWQHHCSGILCQRHVICWAAVVISCAVKACAASNALMLDGRIISSMLTTTTAAALAYCNCLLLSGLRWVCDKANKLSRVLQAVLWWHCADWSRCWDQVLQRGTYLYYYYAYQREIKLLCSEWSCRLRTHHALQNCFRQCHYSYLVAVLHGYTWYHV